MWEMKFYNCRLLSLRDVRKAYQKNLPTSSAESHTEDGGSRFLQNIIFL
jgi:hypothetical protein